MYVISSTVEGRELILTYAETIMKLCGLNQIVFAEYNPPLVLNSKTSIIDIHLYEKQNDHPAHETNS